MDLKPLHMFHQQPTLQVSQFTDEDQSPRKMEKWLELFSTQKRSSLQNPNTDGTSTFPRGPGRPGPTKRFHRVCPGSRWWCHHLRARKPDLSTRSRRGERGERSGQRGPAFTEAIGRSKGDPDGFIGARGVSDHYRPDVRNSQRLISLGKLLDKRMMISVFGINVLAPLRCWCHRQYVVNV